MLTTFFLTLFTINKNLLNLKVTLTKINDFK